MGITKISFVSTANGATDSASVFIDGMFLYHFNSFYVYIYIE